jgi:Tol biopolymer transport system component
MVVSHFLFVEGIKGNKKRVGFQEFLKMEDKMKNRYVYPVFVVLIIVSLAACAVPPALTMAPMVPTTQPPAPPTQPSTDIPPTSIPIPPGTLAISMGNQTLGMNVTQDNIFIIKTDGTVIQQITKGEESTYKEDPSWAPDGKNIVFDFVDSVNDDFNIWKTKDGDSGYSKITNKPTIGLFPAWSPDGNQIVFTNFNETNQCEISLVNPDGSGLKNVTSGPTDIFPIWTPDGKILFIRKGGICEDMTGDVFSIKPDGTELNQITKNGHVGGVGISPDGNTIAYYDTKKKQIYISPLDGSEPPKEIFSVPFSTNFIQPAWSPDGKTIAVAAKGWMIVYGSPLYLVNADGSSIYKVPLDFGVLDPVWKPE